MSETIVPLGMDSVRYDEAESVDDGTPGGSRPNALRDGRRLGDDGQQQLMVDCVFPPVEWVDDGGTRWRRRVSRRPAARTDSAGLTGALHASLERFQARGTDVCPIRSAVYAQCFDETIRQVTIDDAERGFMLVKIRDELCMTVDAYRSLYDSGMSFDANVFANLAARDNELDGLRKRVAELETETQNVADDLAMAKTVHNKVRRLVTEPLDADENIDRLEKSNQQIQALLRSIVEP